MSWGDAPAMVPGSTQPSVTAKKLIEVMTLDCEEPLIACSPDGKRKKYPYFDSISYFPNGKEMVSASGDRSVRRWDLQAGKEIEEARIVCQKGVLAVAVSRDGRWVVAGGGDLSYDNPGELKACEAETGMVKTLDHLRTVTCIDISMDNKLFASGSMDRTVRIWNLNTGELVAGPFERGDRISWVGAVRFSQDSKKLAVKSTAGTCPIEVWDLQKQNLDVTVGKPNVGFFPNTPVFWTKKDRSIVAASTFTVYEFNSSTLETVGAPFGAHTRFVDGLALSFDCALLASVHGLHHQALGV
ncbi:YVTN repeat-like/Quino protein amine dehydrogenase [Rhizopogon vinicolor AM-OR11-026]|uniref:YVTN repeat-like/Quino protein amine dehydrogenase n=1 Tax=Rhizopogon vinicolor AM-OR11-026 TaxID=1314800 RepID=A0A1B7MLS0_9AGAM|nr:YVTN repeat-like/Quino protein amine dehydrogenase [Rhizopogon vinicolor AM-OR11-026]